MMAVKRKKNSSITRLREVIFLLFVMFGIGMITTIAIVNTYEVVFRKDTIYSDVITNVKLTNNKSLNERLVVKYNTSIDGGSFGAPGKIKFPESRLHIDITPANIENGQWKATKGLAQTFLTHEPIQKVFGQAIIYLRYNTPTTKHLGNILSDDIISIVTTEGWQLGYKVDQTANNLTQLIPDPSSASQIVVVMVDDISGNSHCFNASLVKVGGRI